MLGMVTMIKQHKQSLTPNVIKLELSHQDLDTLKQSIILMQKKRQSIAVQVALNF